MKKLICIILSVVFIFGMVDSAFAADVDMSSMSIEDLVSLRDSLNEEIYSRSGGTMDDMIYAGTYVAGKDIKAGIYTITNTRDSYLTIYVFESMDAYNAYEQDSSKTEGRLSHGECNMGNTLNVNLDDGNVMCIRRGEGICKSSKPSWAP